MKEVPRKFETLDALRGVAALLVVVHHLHYDFSRHNPKHLYLAVDLFFQLSGFVLSFAYQEKLDGGLPTFRFLFSRLIRLWPLYLLGVAFGIGAMVLYHRPVQIAPLVVNVLFVPDWMNSIDGALFPFDGPTWTLSLELIANVLHAIFLRRARTRTVALWVGASGCLLAFTYHRMHFLDAGWSPRSFLVFGIPRVLFSYSLGLLLYRIWKRHRGAFTLPAWVPCTALILILIFPFPNAWKTAYPVFAIYLIFPLLILYGADNQPTKLIKQTFTYLGTASYAVYVLHEPLNLLFQKLWLGFGSRPAENYAPWSGLLFLLMVTVFALTLDRYYDLPARKALRRKFKV